jgi:hypothetical protein
MGARPRRAHSFNAVSHVCRHKASRPTLLRQLRGEAVVQFGSGSASMVLVFGFRITLGEQTAMPEAWGFPVRDTITGQHQVHDVWFGGAEAAWSGHNRNIVFCSTARKDCPAARNRSMWQPARTMARSACKRCGAETHCIQTAFPD